MLILRLVGILQRVKSREKYISSQFVLFFLSQTDENVCSSSSSYLLELLLPQSVCEAGRVALLVQIHLHELLDGQLTGGRVAKLHQPDTGQEVRIRFYTRKVGGSKNVDVPFPQRVLTHFHNTDDLFDGAAKVVHSSSNKKG